MHLINVQGLILLGIFLFPLLLTGQHKPIQGVVYDEEGHPYEGATISANGGNSSAFTNENGKFSIWSEESRVNLNIRALGYKEVVILLDQDTISQPLHILFTPAPSSLEEIQVKSKRIQSSAKNSSYTSDLITVKNVSERQNGTLISKLSALPGVQAMSAGTGLSKPMIRGMGFYRVSLAQNGIKHYGQQWSDHHAVLFEAHRLDEIEILKGPLSLFYGSDAMGGVINILPHKVGDGFNGMLYLNLKSNNSALIGNADLSYGKNGKFFELSLKQSTYADFRIPETAFYLLPSPHNSLDASHRVELGRRVHNTAGDENGVHIYTGLDKSWVKSWIDLQYQTNIAGFFDWQGLQGDGKKELHEISEWDVRMPSQHIEDFAIQHFTTFSFDRDKLEMSLAFQSNITKEFDYLSDRTGNRYEELMKFKGLGNLALELNLQSYSAKTNYFTSINKATEIQAGLSANYQDHKVDGYSHILPDYQIFSAGTYVHVLRRIGHKWTINSGLRYDFHRLKMNEILNPDPAYGDMVFNPSFLKNYPSTALSAGLKYFSNNFTFTFNIGKSYRVPSVYELGAYGLHRHNGRFEKGNVSNNPEVAWQTDAAVSFSSGKWQIRISPFFNYFINYLYLAPSSTLRPEGQVYNYEQARAILTGTEFTFQYQICPDFRFQSAIEYVYAVNMDRKTALPLTPPLDSRTSLRYTFKGHKSMENIFIDLEVVAVAPQNFTIPNELVTPGYILLNFNVGSDIRIKERKFRWQVSVMNMLNQKYFNHLSFYRKLRIPEPGRSVDLMLEIPLNNNY